MLTCHMHGASACVDAWHENIEEARLTSPAVYGGFFLYCDLRIGREALVFAPGSPAWEPFQSGDRVCARRLLTGADVHSL